MLQHAETILPAGEIQADLNCHTAGVSDFHAWGLITLPCQPNYIPFGCRSQVPGLDGDGNWAALRLEASLADLLATNSYSGTLMPKINGLVAAGYIGVPCIGKFLH